MVKKCAQERREVRKRANAQERRGTEQINGDYECCWGIQVFAVDSF